MSGTENILYSSLASRYNLRESAEWQKLLRHFALGADGFAFIVLLVPDVDGAEICCQTLEQRLAENGKTLWRIPLEKTDDLKLLAGKLLDLKLPESAGAVWVSATAHQTLSEEEHWKAAWREGMAQLNQYRNPLRNRIETTLIFAGAPWLQEVIRQMAPDLWSVRTLVVKVQPQLLAEPAGSSVTSESDQEDIAASDPELALREAEKLRGQPGKELALARMLHRAGEGLMERNQWREAISRFEEAADLKKRFHDDAESLGLTLMSWGRCLNVQGQNKRATAVLREALVLFRQAGAKLNERKALSRLGIVSRHSSNAKDAIAHFEQSLDIARQIADRSGEATVLSNLGLVYWSLGDPRKAIEFHEKALAGHRAIGNRSGEGYDLSNLGLAYADLGELRKAIEFHEQALTIHRFLGDRRGEGYDLGNLGAAYARLGEPRKALEFYEQALTIHRAIGDRLGEGTVLSQLGLAYAGLGESRKAIEFYERSLTIAREISDRRGEGNALWNMALALDALGERDRAVECAEAALKIFEEIESPHAAIVREQLAEWRGQS